MSGATLAALWIAVGATVGGLVVAVIQRLRARTTPAVGRPPVPDAASGAVLVVEERTPDTSGVVEERTPGVPEVRADIPPPPPAPAPPVPELDLRPHPFDPVRTGEAALIPLAGLAALAGDVRTVDAMSVALSADDLATLDAAMDAVVDGGVVALPGPARPVLDLALRALHARLGDVAVLGVPGPRRASTTGHAREPMQDLIADPSALAAAGRCVVLVEDAELHLRRGLDRAGLDRLRAAAPAAVVMLHVGACEHDASAVDDTGRWLTRMVLDLGGDRVVAAGAHDPMLDVPLLAAVEDAPLLADLAEAAAYARAAGCLADVPLASVARVAALLAGGRAEEPAPDWRIGAALAADTSEPPLLRFDALDGSGLPTTLRAPSMLVARCVADPAVLGPELLLVLLDGIDPVEQLLVARRLTASERPGLALPVLDRLVASGEAVGPAGLVAEAQLVRGVARDRLALATAADDYHAVATGRHGALSAHGAFLLGGILETASDLAPARAAYRSAIAADDPVHSAMAAFNLAWLDEREGSTDAASAAYREVVTSEHPDAAPMAALNLATLLERGKRFAECESWYRTAIESGHADVAPMAAVSLGLMLERRQRPREARALFRTAASSGHAEAAPIALRRLGAPRR